MRDVPWAQLAVLACCAVQSRRLPIEWMKHTPYERFGWIALAVWLIPLAMRPWSRDPRPTAMWPSYVGLVLAFIGTVGDLNAIIYVGTAFAAAALLPPGWRWLAWLACAASWWTAFGYLLTSQSTTVVATSRIAVAAIGVALVLLPLSRAVRSSPTTTEVPT
ncbi:MAG TPA: hypothetical protein VEL07_14700 [Planctomycetota bacterium]|nr:hypothetical protein [Planctomycetota bacterium]